MSEDIRWTVNVLLEKIAVKFETWDTMDLWRSDAAQTVRGFKHDLAAPGIPAQQQPSDLRYGIADIVQAFASGDYHPTRRDCEETADKIVTALASVSPQERDATAAKLNSSLAKTLMDNVAYIRSIRDAAFDECAQIALAIDRLNALVERKNAIADAIEKCDWSNTSIDHKEILKAACAALRSVPPQERDIFDLLEAVADGLLKSGHEDAARKLQGSFSQFTGGVDYEWLGQVLTPQEKQTKGG